MDTKQNISETAIIVASLRALSNYEQDEKFRCNDQYAEIFLPPEKQIPKDVQTVNLIKKSIPKGMLEYVIARTKYIDSIFINSLNQNISQIVFLGAGFDSRSYRFNHLIKTSKIFEVDTKATQEYKRTILKNKNQVFENINYIEADFEKDNVFEKLIENGYNISVKTLFIWEGVTFYLTINAVKRMLMEIRKNSGRESMICFDFQTIKNMKDLIKTGIEETIKFGIEEGKINEFISSNKYSIIEHLNSKEIEQRFMKKETSDLFGEIAPIMNFILIEHK